MAESRLLCCTDPKRICAASERLGLSADPHPGWPGLYIRLNQRTVHPKEKEKMTAGLQPTHPELGSNTHSKPGPVDTLKRQDS